MMRNGHYFFVCNPRKLFRRQIVFSIKCFSNNSKYMINYTIIRLNFHIPLYLQILKYIISSYEINNDTETFSVKSVCRKSNLSGFFLRKKLCPRMVVSFDIKLKSLQIAISHSLYLLINNGHLRDWKGNYSHWITNINYTLNLLCLAWWTPHINRKEFFERTIKRKMK